MPAARLLAMPRWIKRSIMLVADAVLLPVALWAAIGLRLEQWNPAAQGPWWAFLLPPLVSIPIFIRMGLYRSVIRYLEDRALFTIAVAVTVSEFGLVAAIWMVGNFTLPRGALLIYWLLAVTTIAASRFMTRSILLHIDRAQVMGKRVLIYGSGAAVPRALQALRASRSFLPVALVDDDPRTHGLDVGGVRVYAPSEMRELLERMSVEQVLLAMPSASRARRIAIINELEPLGVAVRSFPEITDLVDGSLTVDDIRDVDIEELLGREPVPPDEKLLAANLTGKCVMVTGAGGSIGSELCRQIVANCPRRLVLYEISEFALYAVEQEIEHLIARDGQSIDIVPVLGSVTNQARMSAIMRRFGVETVYHAAAYKHVPMVEFNVTEGVRNNVLGTQTAASAAVEAGVETFVLISTDKAVRPTNIMGASKRMAEMVLQALAAEQGVLTRFCIVRFGNVLGSSGSVVPRFRKQIAAGGPVTVTHPEVTRYFMTIPEAALLVIQAGAMGGSGTVYVLDMGGPVRILEMARRMIHLSGLTVKEVGQPDGDIEIAYTGLRPGEKLYEELLIGDAVSGTRHPRIMQAAESFMPLRRLESVLHELAVACDAHDSQTIVDVFRRHVTGFTPETQIRDHLADSGVVAAVPAVPDSQKIVKVQF